MIHPNRYGVIDLGTNTFHLLIIDRSDTSFKIIYRARVYVKLGQGGVKYIGKEAFDRGMKTLNQFKSSLEKFHCHNFKCVGTAALRKSSNASEFISAVREKIGIQIEVISGEQEAYYIYKGIEKVFSFKQNYTLIMDIGGGSVEFIIANIDGIVYSESIPMGIAILKNKFHRSNPMSKKEQDELKTFYLEHTLKFKQNLEKYKPLELIGSSGTFDVLDKNLEKTILNNSISRIDISAFEIFAKKILNSTVDQLKIWKAIPDERVDLISVAIQLILLSLDLSKTSHLFSSKSALKEGLIASMPT